MGASAVLTMTKGVPLYDTDTRNFVGSSNSTTWTLPSDEKANDLLVSVNWIKNASSLNWSVASSGYTSRYNQGALPSVSLFTKVDSGSEGTANFTTSASGTWLFGMLLRFRMATFDAVGSAVVIATNGTLTTTGYTSAGGLACLALVADTTAATMTTPTGWTQIFNDNTSFGGIGRGALFTQVVPAGAVASAASTVASNTGNVAGLMFGLK